MKKLYFKIFTVVAAICCFGLVNAQGDTCTAALPVLAGGGLITADGPAVGVITDGAEGPCIGTPGTAADWYSFTATGNGTIDVSSDGTAIDTRVSIYSGTCAALVCEAGNDDIAAPTNYASAVLGQPVTVGETYLIMWDDRWSGTGFDWTLDFTATGDTCTTAIPVGVGTHTADGPAIGGIADGAANSCAGTGATASDWYSFTAGADGTIDVSSDGTATDTRLSIHSGTCAALVCEGFNDDIAAPVNYASEVLGLAVTSGNTYLIEWDDRWSGSGFDWTLAFTPAPTCDEPTALSASGTLTDATITYTSFVGSSGELYEIQPAGVAQGTLGALSSGTNILGSPILASGTYQAATAYTAYVASLCGTLGIWGDTSTYASVDFVVPATIACGPYTSSPAAIIDDANDPSDTITVVGTGGMVVSDLNVVLDITHTFTADLDISLTSPTGVTFNLMLDQCGGDDNVNVVLDDEGSAIDCGGTTVTGVIIPPSGALSNFDGLVFDGDWSINIVDDAGGDNGVLNSWCLVPTLAAPPSCGSVFGLVVVQTVTDVTVSWDSTMTGTPIGYNYELQNTADPIGTLPTVGGGPFSTIGADTSAAYASGLFTNGNSYTFYVNAVCGTFGDTASITFTANIPPVNDLAAGALPIACGDSVVGNTDLATPDFVVGGGGCDEVVANSLWYTFTGTGSPQTVTLSTCNDGGLTRGNADYDTKISVYADAGGTMCLGQNDDGAGCGGFSSQMNFTSDGVSTYYIQVHGFNAFSSGNFAMSVDCVTACTPAETNQDCATATPQTVGAFGSIFTTVYDNTCATSALSNPSCDLFANIQDLWVSFVAPGTGEVNLILNAVSATEAHVVVYSGACGSLVEEFCSDVFGNESLTLTGLTFGDTYYVQMYNDGGAEEGTMVLGLENNNPPPPPAVANDSSVNAIPLSCGDVELGSTFNSTLTPDEAGACGSGNPNPGVWYSFEGTGDDVTVSLCGTAISWDSQMDVSSGAPGALTCLADNDQFCGDLSEVTFSSAPGTDYYIRVYGWNVGTPVFGDFEISVTCVTPPPAGGFVWNGAVDSDWTNSLNWAGGVAPMGGCADTVFISNAPNAPSIATATTVGEFTMAASATADIPGVDALIVCGNATFGAGSSVTGAGFVQMDSTGFTPGMGGAIDVLGGACTLFSLNIVTNTDMNSGTLGVENDLTLTGDFTNNSEVVLKSSATGTAILQNFGGFTGVYSGDLTVETFITPGVGLGQRLIGAAVTGGSVTGLDGTYSSGLYGTGQLIPTATCDPTILEMGSPYSALLSWNEADVTACAQEGFTALAESSILVPGLGYSAWVNDGSVISVTGTVNNSTSIGGFANSGSGVIDAEGWHLLGNPYAAPIAMSDVAASGFSSPMYYNADAAFSGTYSAITPASLIPIGQGFSAESDPGVQTWAPTTRVADASVAFNASEAYFTSKLEVIVNGNGFADKTDLYFADHSTIGFDSYGDCKKRDSDFGQPTLYTSLDGQEMALNGYPVSNIGESVEMGLKPGAKGTFTFSFDGLSTFASSTAIYLEDKAAGTFHNIANGDYTFTMVTTENEDRFELHFVAPAEIAVTNVSCDGSLGSIAFNTIDSDTKAILYTNGNAVSSFNNLVAGAYEIELTDVYGGVTTIVTNVEAADAVEAEFVASSLDVEVDEVVTFTNVSSGTSFEWTINGETIANVNELTYAFTEAGLYDVVLNASNDDCSDSRTYTINVADKSTSIQNLGDGQLVRVFANANVVNLSFENVDANNAQVEVFNLLGQTMAIATVVAEGDQTLTVPNAVDGYYIVKLTVDGKSTSTKVLLTKN